MSKVKEKRHWTPHSKGLTGSVLPIRFRKAETLHNLSLRARYETLHFRLEHKGKGPTVSPGDIVRRLIEEFFERVSPLPDDSIGTALRELIEREEGRIVRRTAKTPRPPH